MASRLALLKALKTSAKRSSSSCDLVDMCPRLDESPRAVNEIRSFKPKCGANGFPRARNDLNLLLKRQKAFRRQKVL